MHFASIIAYFVIEQKSQKYEAQRQLVWNDGCTMNSIDCTIAPVHSSSFCMPPRESQRLDSRRKSCAQLSIWFDVSIVARV